MSTAKPLQVNPFKLSQPMGAMIAFLGVKDCMPLMHGAQGCASFSKVFFTRHFCEPMAIQTTAVSDITAVLDGGAEGIKEAIENILKKSSPKMIGLFSTGLTETKGDDLKGACSLIDTPTVYVNTPDYEGALESGFAKAVSALINQLVRDEAGIDLKKITIIPNVSMTPLEIEKVKDLIESFGFSVFALPDISTSLDGFLGKKQGSKSVGGIEIDDIKNLANSRAVITIGESVYEAGENLKLKNSKIEHIHFSSLGGLNSSDELICALMRLSNLRPSPRVQRWRSRLCDMMLDSHFEIGKKRFLVAAEFDEAINICKILKEVGGEVPLCVLPTEHKKIELIEADNVLIGDFEDIEKNIDKVDILITNFHGERIAKRHHKTLVLRGYPNFEEVGNQLTYDVLYEGGCYFLKEIANKIIENSNH